MTLIAYIIIAHRVLFIPNQACHFSPHLIELSARKYTFEDAELNWLAKAFQQLE
jgi:hypothetical protein